MSTDGENTSVGNYRLIAELGQGGMADVFLAVVHGPAGFNKLRVIKRLRAHLADEPEFLAMFLDEARLAAKLNHPNVVQTIEVGQEGNRYFIAMEYLDGQPLHRVLHRASKRGGIPLSMRVSIVAEMLLGLNHAHDACDFDGTPMNIVHRDVTPHNVFVTYDGQVKIVDFGIAKAVNSSTETRAGVVKGKVAYMAPEQAMGGKVDRRADVFAAGVMLWEAVTGSRMWKGLSQLEILQRVSHGKVPSAKSVNPEVPDQLDAICRKATARKVDDRYASAADLHAAIEAACDELGLKAKTREIGAFVSELFEDKREAIKAIVESQVNQMGEEDAASALPVLNTASHTMEHQSASGLSAAIPPADSSSSAGITSGGAVVAPARPRRVEKKSKASGIAAGLMVIAAAAVMGWYMVQQGAAKKPAQAGGATPVATATADATSTAAPAASSMVVINGEPTGAKVLIDGESVGTIPFAGKLPQDSAAHTIQVSADGYDPKSETVVFDSPKVEKRIELVKGTKPASRPAPARPANKTKPGEAPTDEDG